MSVNIIVPKYAGFSKEMILFGDVEDMTPVSIILPDPPNLNKVDNYKRPKTKQKWEPIPKPRHFQNFKRLNRNQIYDKLTNDDHQFIQNEFNRIDNGYWFFNNGVLTYMSGHQYMYLNDWSIDIGLPSYRDIDRRFFLHWNKIEKDDECFGLVEMTRRRMGKCFAINTLIRMHDGSVKKVQDIKDGEMVMGDDSTPRLVEGTTSGEEEMFEIIPNKGDSFTVNKSHILSLYYNKPSANLKRGWKGRSIISITVSDYMGLTDSEKSHLVLYRRGWGKDYKENSHVIPPYILGVYLGDGCREFGSITNPDKEIIAELQKYCDNNNMNLSTDGGILYRIVRKSNCADSPLKIEVDGKALVFDSIRKLNEYFGWGYDSRRHLRRWFKEKYKLTFMYESKQNPYRKELIRLGVMPNKTIPNDYLIDSEFNRLELLAGILDTDGHLQSGKKSHLFEVTQKSKEVSDAIVELSRSLGFYTSIYKKIAVLKREGREDYRCLVYRIRISGPNLHKIPTRVKRKQVPSTYEPRVDSRNTGFIIKSKGIGEYYGFSVDKNHLFLLEDGMVVHNTFKSGLILYHGCFRNFNWKGGIQSKTDKDAKELFSKAVVSPWRKLPFYLQPVFDNSTNPSEMLYFYSPAKRGENNSESFDSEALESSIEIRSSVNGAFDGYKLHRSVDDEAAKGEPPIDISERWDIKKLCLQVDGKIVGKELCTSTIEDMEGLNGEKFKDIWDKSDPNPQRKNKDGSPYLDERGRTPSGLHRHFTPAYDGYKLDEFGNSLIEESKRELEMERKQMASNPAKLSKFKRRMPFTIKEAFRGSGKQCPFNLEIIEARLEDFTFENPYKTRGNFRWKDNEPDTTVIFEPSNNGKFWVTYLFDDPAKANNLLRIGNRKIPNNDTLFIAGADPYKFKTNAGTKGSKGSGAVFMMHDSTKDDADKDVSAWTTNRFVCSYQNRPTDKNIYGEDMLMMCHYYGCKLFPEINVPFLWDYFEDRGYGGFLLYTRDANNRLSKTPGGNTSDKMREDILAEVESYVEKHGGREQHDEVLEAFRDVDASDFGPHDLFVACGYALVGARKGAKTKKRETTEIIGAPFTIYEID